MAVKIRLQRKGRKKAPFYHLVVADARSPRDGRFIEKIGTYNPLTRPATIDVDRDKAFDWLMKGAQPTDTARAILRFKGVYYRKHLALGVGKGALTQEEADTRYNAWSDEKEAKIAARFAKTAEEKAAFHALVSGQPKPKKAAPAPAAVVVEDAPATVVEEEAAEVEGSGNCN
jgi:small subunit ribosomal protein S16